MRHRIRVEKSFAFEKAKKRRVARDDFNPRARYEGFDEVIEAMPELLRRFPSLKYMIVGDGDDRGRLEEK